MTDAIRVTEEFLGEGKGVLNIMADKLSKCIGKNTTHGGILLVALVLSSQNSFTDFKKISYGFLLVGFTLNETKIKWREVRV